MVSESAQDYLKAIWKLERTGDMSTSALAESLGVAPASATAMLKKLATLGLVVHERYHGATLTPAGERMALEVVRHHRLLELYLMEALGLVPAEEVTVVEQASFDGPVTVEVRGSRHAIGRSLAAQIDVGVEHAAAG